MISLYIIDKYFGVLYNDIMQTKAHIQATNRYEKKAYDKITLRIRKDGGNGFTRDDVKQYADRYGESVAEFILKAIKERMQ